MDLKRLSNDELRYELNDVNEKLSEMMNSRRKGCLVPQKKFNSYLDYKRELQREMRKRAK